MRKIFFLLCWVLVAQLSKAQNRSGISIGFDVAQPVGPMSDEYKQGYGFSFQLKLPLEWDKFYGQLYMGVLNFRGKYVNSTFDNKLNSAVVKAGLGYAFSEIFYADAGVGIAILNRGFGYAFVASPAVGARIPIGKKMASDISLRNEHWFGRKQQAFCALRLSVSF